MTFAIRARKSNSYSHIMSEPAISAQLTITYSLNWASRLNLSIPTKKHSLHHHFCKCSRVIQPRHWGDASFDLAHTILVDRASFFTPLTLTDCRSDEMTGDQWRSHPLKWLQVSLQGVPALFDLPSSACRAAAPSDFPVIGETGSPVQKFHCYFWVTARERDWRL